MNYIYAIMFTFIGITLGYALHFAVSHFIYKRSRNAASKIVEDAKVDAEVIKKDAIREAKEEILLLKSDNDRRNSEKREELKDYENKLNIREIKLENRDEHIIKKEEAIDLKEKKLAEQSEKLKLQKEVLDRTNDEQLEILEKIGKFSREEAKSKLFERVESQIERDLITYAKDTENKAKLEVDRKAKGMLIECMEKYSNDVVSEQAITVVNLPSDDIKGKLIGREGRNIRAIEAVTGVDLIIDDTPEAIVLSCFDPYRREIARITIEALIKDGRIHPSRIEELYDKSLKEVNDKIREYGETAVYELGLTKVDAELIELIGKLYFRTSYGQNALQHSIEVAHFAGSLAAELGENVTLAKRAGLLHDIGKSISSEIDGSHVELGFDIAKRFSESDTVLNAIMSHHGEEESRYVISSLVAIADTLSAARPGARNDITGGYIKRLDQLEEIPMSFNGVEKAYAVSAGRELRVLVKSDEIDDIQSYKLAKDIKEKIEAEAQYPGTVKITVIRETRVQEEAR